MKPPILIQQYLKNKDRERVSNIIWMVIFGLFAASLIGVVVLGAVNASTEDDKKCAAKYGSVDWNHINVDFTPEEGNSGVEPRCENTKTKELKPV